MQYGYNHAYDPPAAVLPVRVGAPGADTSVLVSAMVDSGADMCVVPAGLALQLGLPMVDVLRVRGVGGAAHQATVHAASVQVGHIDDVAEVLAIGDETLVGRNLLRFLVVGLDGPGDRLTVS